MKIDPAPSHFPGSSPCEWPVERRSDPPLSANVSLGGAGFDGGFTLVEMLVVVGIIVLLLGLIGPITTSMMRGMQLSTVGDSLSGQLQYARQVALTSNRNIEVRFCQSTSNNPAYFTTIALLQYPYGQSASTATRPATLVGKPVTLPNSVIIDGGATLSSILNQTPLSAGTPSRLLASPSTNSPPTSPNSYDPPIGSLGQNYKCVSFQFRPDGSTDLLQYQPTGTGTTNPRATHGLSRHTP